MLRTPLANRFSQTRSVVLLLALLVIGISLFTSKSFARFFASAPTAAGTISGTVFQDYNGNGAFNSSPTQINNNGAGTIGVATDRGIAGLTVTAYNAANQAVGSSQSDASGNYSINATGTGPYRVEFTNLPAGFVPGTTGADSRTTVQFVGDGNSSNVSLAIIIPQEFCQDNPDVATSCYVYGAQLGANPTVLSFPYSAGSTRTTGEGPYTDFDAPTHPILANEAQAGTTWGLAYARGTRQLFAGAFMKKHTGYGPGGTGAIYSINRNNGAVSVAANLNTIFGANTAGANTHNPADYNRDNDNLSWDAVGKAALGGLAISDDESQFFAVNLADRSLYAIPLNQAATSSNTRRSAIPTNLPGCSSASDARPFALKNYQGRLYVGVVCSAESTITTATPNGDASKMRGYVYAVNPTDLSFSAQPVFEFPLNYPRRCTDSAELGPNDCYSAAWRPWSPVYRNIGSFGRGIYPQPMFTDIEFDNGNLVIGLRDRAGDQFGNNALDSPTDHGLYYGIAAGDTLRACGSASGGWTFENNGRCGGRGVGPQSNGQGPGGSEFYFGDFYDPWHDEVGLGGLLQLPGRPDVAYTAFDPIFINDDDTLWDGGVHWTSNGTGARAKVYRVYNGEGLGSDLLGKANGLGDLVALCDPAPIEIGNRVWNDSNANGIQDANEEGLSGLAVRLFKNGQQVGTTTTNNQGLYYFNASNVSGGVLPNMAYEIRIDKGQPSLTAATLSNKDADATPNGDSRDSDAAMVGSDAVIAVTTGDAGRSDHTLDAGFVIATITCPSSVMTILTYPTPTSSPAGAPVTCNPPSGTAVPVGTTLVTCSLVSNPNVKCSFNVTVGITPVGAVGLREMPNRKIGK